MSEAKNPRWDDARYTPGQQLALVELEMVVDDVGFRVMTSQPRGIEVDAHSVWVNYERLLETTAKRQKWVKAGCSLRFQLNTVRAMDQTPSGFHAHCVCEADLQEELKAEMLRAAKAWAARRVVAAMKTQEQIEAWGQADQAKHQPHLPVTGPAKARP